jgi:hypothetical protein
LQPVAHLSRVPIVFRIGGAVLILTAVFDVFHTLFHPAKQGAISDWIARHIWFAIRKLSTKYLQLAGPLAFITIVFYWVASTIIGFALIYLPSLPHSFAYVAGLRPDALASFVGALEVSISSLITLSSGVYSRENWLGLVMGLESIVGFGLLTASVSWILSIYPILEHRKSLAREASLVYFSELHELRRLDEVADSDVQQILMGLASQLITARNELMQFPITYYFHEDEKDTSLAGILPYLADIAAENVRRHGGAAMGAVALGCAVDDYLNMVSRIFLARDFSTREQSLNAFAEDHIRQPVHAPQRLPKAA